MADSPVHSPDTLATAAHADAGNIGKITDVHKQAEAYHDAYTSFANQLQNDPNRDQSLKQYREDLGKDLGAARLGELDLTWAGDHLDKFQSAHKTETATTDSGRRIEIPALGDDLSGDKLGKFSSNNSNAAEKSFENSVAGDIAGRYNKSEFHMFSHDIAPVDLTARAAALGKDAQKMDVARLEARGLLSPVSPELATALGKTHADGSPTTLYDLLAQPDGSISKYGYQTQLDRLHDALPLSGKLTPEQSKTVRDLWDNYATDPLRSGDGKITPESIKAATGLDGADLQKQWPADAPHPTEAKPPAAAPDATKPEAAKPDGTKPEATKPDATKPESTKPEATKPESTKPDATKPEATKPEDTKPEPVKPEDAKHESHSFKLGHGSLLDQVAKDLRSHNDGKAASPEAVRAQLAAIAKANKWPGSEAQWDAYVKDGATRHLPKTLNSHLRAGMDVTVPQ